MRSSKHSASVSCATACLPARLPAYMQCWYILIAHGACASCAADPPEGPQWDSFSLTGATTENWETVRAEFPVLAARSDEELAGALRTYLNKGPDLFGVLTQTPVGPVILINILLYVTGITWCDTPLGTAAACAQVAARKAAGE